MRKEPGALMSGAACCAPQPSGQRVLRRMAAFLRWLIPGAVLQPMPGKGNGGNHAMWIVGHLAVIEGDIPAIVFGEQNPVEHWRPLFGIGTQPKNEAGAYPPFDEVLARYRDLRARNLKLL